MKPNSFEKSEKTSALKTSSVLNVNASGAHDYMIPSEESDDAEERLDCVHDIES